VQASVLCYPSKTSEKSGKESSAVKECKVFSSVYKYCRTKFNVCVTIHRKEQKRSRQHSTREQKYSEETNEKNSSRREVLLTKKKKDDSDEISAQLVAWVEEDRRCTLSKLSTMVKEQFDVDISKRTIRTFMSNKGYFGGSYD